MSIFSGKCDLADSIRDKSLHGLLEFARDHDIFEYTGVFVGKRNVEAYAEDVGSLPTFIKEIRIERTKRGLVKEAYAVLSDGEEFRIDLTGRSRENSVRIIRRVDEGNPGGIAMRLRRIIAMASWGTGVSKGGKRGFVLLTHQDHTETTDRSALAYGYRRGMRKWEERYYGRYLWSILPWTLAYEQAPDSTLRFSQEVGVSGMQVLTFENPATGKCFDIQAMMEFDDPDDCALFDMLLHEEDMKGRGLEEVSAFLGAMGDDGRILFAPETAKEIAKHGLRFKKNCHNGGDEE